LRIGWVDPEIVQIAVGAVESTDDREALPAVLTQDQLPVHLEDAVRIFWVNDHFCEIKRTPDHPGALVALFPGGAAVIGNEERAVG
jgi:hypothetical protein